MSYAYKSMDRLFINNNPQFASFCGARSDTSVRISSGDQFVYPSTVALMPPRTWDKSSQDTLCKGKDVSDILITTHQRYYTDGVTSYHERCSVNRALSSEYNFSLGFELEFYTKTPEIYDAIKSGQLLTSNWFHMHSDGSLPWGGAELVSIPLPADVVLNPDFWSKSCAMWSRFLTCKNVSQCGLHFHINRAFFVDGVDRHTPDEERTRRRSYINALALLYYRLSKRSKPFFNNLFGRETQGYCKSLSTTYTMDSLDSIYTACRSGDHKVSESLTRRIMRKVFANFTSPNAGDRFDRWQRAYPFFDQDRYQEINVQDPTPSDTEHTVEFRRGKALLDPQHIHAMVSFIYVLSTFVREELIKGTALYDIHASDKLLDKLVYKLVHNKHSDLLSYFAAKYLSGMNEAEPPLPWLTADIAPESGKVRL